MKPSGLDPDRWRRIDAVLDAALQTPPAERPAFLSEACAGDDELRKEVEALLDAHDRATPLDRPVSPLGAALVSASEPDPAGRTVGPFRIVREIGRGGMGVVYLAEDTRLGRRVALKALPPYLGAGSDARRRFLAEARAVSALDHPNIATLYESDATDEGQLYMVFAFYEGETLQARIARGLVPPDEAVTIALGIAEGLAAAHRLGIIHRDVKPSNILLTHGGEAKLLDFGVAKVTGEETTGAGTRLGTVAYMSPEQASGTPLDARTDLWSLGVVLFEMLTGRRPFGEGDAPVLIQRILQDEPGPVGSPGAEPPEMLRRVVARLLRKRPDDRYQQAENLLTDLRALRAGTDPPHAAREPLPSRGALSAGTRRWLAMAAGAAAVGAGLWLATRAVGGPGGAIERLAVLPLTNLTGDSGQRYFVDGIHEALIAELGGIGAIDVVSRTSVMRYRDTEQSVPEIARALDVDAVLEGSVARDGDSLTITTQLIGAEPERHLWVGTYRRGVERVLGIPREVARSIAEKMRIELSTAEAARLADTRAVDPAAYDAYTLGLFSLESRRREGFELAQRYFRRAIAIDSTFAPAYAALGETIGEATTFGLLRPSVGMPLVRALLERALAMDSTLADAHASLAALTLYADWDWPGAERRVRQAIALNPSQPFSYTILAEVLAVQGRYDEAIAAIERATRLHRFTQFAAFMPAVMRYYARDYDQAIAGARAGLEFFPGFWQGRWLLCLSLAALGRPGEAVPECEDATAQSGRTAMALGSLGFVYALDGRTDAAIAVAHELEARPDSVYVGPTFIAAVYGALGDRDAAFRWMEAALRERDVALVHLREYTLFDPLRADSRFAAIERQVGLE